MSEHQIRSDSDRALQEAVYVDPSGVSTLGDKSVIKLCLDPPLEQQRKPLIKASLVAEILLRRWLYAPEAGKEFDTAIKSIVPNDLNRECESIPGPRTCPRYFAPANVQFNEGSFQMQAWRTLLQRIRAFTAADGLIPVVCADGTSIALPFTLNDTDPPRSIMDAAGKSAINKAGEAQGLWSYAGEDYSVRLCCNLREPMVGSSFALPVLIAIQRKRGLLDFPHLAVLSTGEIRDGSVHNVGDRELKMDLAVKLGVDRFFATGSDLGLPHFPLNSGLNVKEALRIIRDALNRGGARHGAPNHRLRPLDFSNYINYKCKGFTGREWLLEHIELWPCHDTERALLIVGEPGMGKSAILAQLIHRNPGASYVAHHFCQSDEKKTLNPGEFVRSLAAMLAEGLPAYARKLDNPEVIAALSENDARTTLLAHSRKES